MDTNEIEIKKIINLIVENYDIGNIKKVARNNKGWGENYEILSHKGEYFLKILDSRNPLYHFYDEIEVCTYLNSLGIKASHFIKNKQGTFICDMNNDMVMHLQKFIHGDIWRKNSAPDWLLEAGIKLIAKIHNSLEPYKLSIRSSILNINNTEKAVSEIESLIREFRNIDMIDINEKSQIINDLCYRLDSIKNQKYINLNKLTFVNSHSDFSITQLITNDKSIDGVIDFTEVSRVPTCWEILRFYLDSAPESYDGSIDINRFIYILSIYERTNHLNMYDKESLFELYYIYLCQAISVYKKILQYKSKKFIDRAKVRMKKIKYLEENKELLKIKII